MNVENHPVVSREEWLAARRQHLAHEKTFTRERDKLSAERRALPWVKIDKPYRFQGPHGELSLADLFGGRSQLIIYHFMFGPGWTEGCQGCSFLSDHIDGANQHLAHHDVALVAVSRAPFAEFHPFKRRMGWGLRLGLIRRLRLQLRLRRQLQSRRHRHRKSHLQLRNNRHHREGELPGLSVFYRNEAVDIFHTYSTYARGLDILVGTYNYLDLTPKGRNEDEIMDWVRHHDKYEEAKPHGCCHS